MYFKVLKVEVFNAEKNLCGCYIIISLGYYYSCIYVKGYGLICLLSSSLID